MFYNAYRSTDNRWKRTSQSVNPREKLINLQKREKLKGLLITKFMKKYGIHHPEKILDDEISKFLQGEKLTAADLSRLEIKIQRILKEKDSNETLKRNLSQEPNTQSESIYNLGEKDPNLMNRQKETCRLPEINQGETLSKCSKISGASNLSKFNEKCQAEKVTEDELEDLEYLSQHPPVERLDFSNEGDEWNAICKYNKMRFEEEKKMEKLKDLEIKRRTREDLDNQVKQKLKRLYEENLKNKEYDTIQLNHIEHMGEIEKQKQMEIKRKILREKENRDMQLKDEKHRKRTEILKDKKYERQLVKHLLDEIEKEKQMMIQKKLSERDALHKTLRDNELNKIKQLEAAKKEKEDDIRACEENAKLLERQENERIEYFKKIERNSNNFMTKMVDTVIKDMENKNKEEEERMKTFENEKEKRAQDEDMKRLQQAMDNKKTLKAYLDMQVDEKRKMQGFEKTLDSEQARIWKTDTKKFYEQEKDINEKVRYMHNINANYLKTQIETKKESSRPKMSDTEYALNRQLLEKMKKTSEEQKTTAI